MKTFLETNLLELWHNLNTKFVISETKLKYCISKILTWYLNLLEFGGNIEMIMYNLDTNNLFVRFLDAS